MTKVDTLIEVLVTATIFGALFPIVTNAINGMGLDNVTVFGTSYDWSFAGYILVLALVLGIVYLAVNQIKKAKRSS